RRLRRASYPPRRRASAVERPCSTPSGRRSATLRALRRARRRGSLEIPREGASSAARVFLILGWFTVTENRSMFPSLRLVTSRKASGMVDEARRFLQEEEGERSSEAAVPARGWDAITRAFEGL